MRGVLISAYINNDYKDVFIYHTPLRDAQCVLVLYNKVGQQVT